jgi:hypothetical protein
MEAPDTGGCMNWVLLLAIVGIASALYWIVVGIIWLFNHISIS